MSLTAGIVGLPNVGKSTLFNAITKKNILAANYPFATIDPNVGVVVVPDDRLNYLNNLYKPKSLVPTTFEFTDIAGLVKGASNGEGLGNKFLSHIREGDAICEVVRCFENDDIIHVEDIVDPIRDIEIIEVELILADLEVVENRFNKIGKKASLSKDKEVQKEAAILSKLKEALEKNIPIRRIELTEDERLYIKPFNLLTSKPIIYVANVSEDDLLVGDNKYIEKVKEYAKKDNAEVVTICAKVESDLCDMDTEEKNIFLSELGVSESGIDKLIKASYTLLGLKTFFTAGEDECRAWTFKDGMKAPQCAGIIHTDFERGFIKAEIMSYEDLKTQGNEKAVKEAGRMRLEGKEYIMLDGDICYFRFNVLIGCEKMKFFCEYCGNRIDAEVDRKCPNCGASYKKNKNFIEIQEEKNKQHEINTEFKNEVMNHTLGVMKVSKFFFIIPIFVFLVIVGVFITIFINVRNNFDFKNGTFKNNIESVTANFNEFGKIDEYGVKVTKYEVVENKFDKPDEGYEYVKFYLMVQNLTNDQITKEDVFCIVNGVSQTNDFTSGYSDLPMFIASNLTVTGTATFLVPKDATSYDIRYGDYITIHIEK